MNKIIATPSSVEVETRQVRFENGLAMNHPFVASWTWEFMRTNNLKGCPYGSGTTGAAAIRDLIEWTNMESQTDIEFSDVPIPAPKSANDVIADVFRAIDADPTGEFNVKPYDRAVKVSVALKEAGFKIVRAPRSSR